jgi:signal transduction histidine kinase
VQVVLIDYRICGMSGNEVVRRFQSLNPHIQVILHGGYSDAVVGSDKPNVPRAEDPEDLLNWVEVGLNTYARLAAGGNSHGEAGEEIEKGAERAFKVLVLGQPEDLQWLVTWLERAGCGVLKASDASIALDQYVRERAHVLIVGQQLQDQRTRDLVRRIRILDPAIPVIAVYHDGDSSQRRQVLESIVPHAVCDGHEPEQVVEAVESALHLTWRTSRARADQDLRTLLMAKFSDDVRNAIHAIQGYAEILRDDSVPRVRNAVTGLSEAAGQALELVQKYLDLARLDCPGMVVRREVVPIDQLLADLRLLARQRIGDRPLRLATKVARSNTTLYTDGEKLGAVLTQLLENAVKFSRAGTIELDVNDGPDAAEFIVRDVGPGIGADELPGLFDPFRQHPDQEQTATPGMGLGLAIARRLTDLLGGSLSVGRGEQGGAVFTLSIPTAREAMSEAAGVLH